MIVSRAEGITYGPRRIDRRAPPPAVRAVPADPDRRKRLRGSPSGNVPAGSPVGRDRLPRAGRLRFALRTISHGGPAPHRQTGTPRNWGAVGVEGAGLAQARFAAANSAAFPQILTAATST